MSEGLWRRIINMIAPCTLTAVDDSGPVQRAQIKIGYMELNDGVPVLQVYGMSSVPPAGSDGTAVFLGGDRSNAVVVATGNQGARPTGQQPGENTIHNDVGMTIYLSHNGITINGGGKPITITNAPTVIQNGDFHATGAVIAGYGGADQVGLQTHETTGVSGGGGTSGPPKAGT